MGVQERRWPLLGLYLLILGFVYLFLGWGAAYALGLGLFVGFWLGYFGGRRLYP